ncbi:MAG: hypothetical protein ACXAEU_20995 [Candidatus Hodarchaeales archaeon]|jgi:hypothetical protein
MNNELRQCILKLQDATGMLEAQIYWALDAKYALSSLDVDGIKQLDTVKIKHEVSNLVENLTTLITDGNSVFEECSDYLDNISSK